MTLDTGIERLLVEIVERARALGCEFADARHMVTRSGGLSLRDVELEGIEDTTTRGVGLRILREGAWGFAALTDLAHGDIDALVRRAAHQAEVARVMSNQHVQLAAEPAHTGSWYSGALIDPMEVPVSEQLDLMQERSAFLLRSPQVNHVDAHLQYVTEIVHYASSDGSMLHQHRIRIMAQWTAIAIDPLTGEFDSMSTTAPPVGRGWEYITGDCHDSGPARRWDWEEEIEALPELLAEKMAAPSVESGSYTLVIHPTNLWLTIHESVGHATELDRSLGYEANYAGTTFVQPDDAGRLQYGSPLMNVVADRTREHGLATVGWDDDGVVAQQWPLITSGVLQGFQVDRSIAAEVGLHRSNGCAYSDAADHVPLQRMPNVSLLADPTGGSIDELISAVDDGIYIVGDRSWSIDMQRYNFQFTGQRFHRIKSGQLAGQVKDVAYQGSTPTFWKSLVAAGGPSTELLCGALNCGKGQPGQVAPVSHGAPAAVFEGVRVLNTREEGRT